MTELDQSEFSELRLKYLDVHERCRHVIHQTFEHDEDNCVSEVYHYIYDITTWYNVLGGRLETILIDKAIREYRSSLFSLVQGHYRNAFMALRAYFEFTLNAIYLSCYPKKLQDWKEGNYRMSFGEAVDNKDGILSESFAKTFNKPLEEKDNNYR